MKRSSFILLFMKCLSFVNTKYTTASGVVESISGSGSGSSDALYFTGYFGDLKQRTIHVVDADVLVTDIVTSCQALDLGNPLSPNHLQTNFLRISLIQKKWPEERNVLLPLYFPDDESQKWCDIRNCEVQRQVEEKSLPGKRCAVLNMLLESDEMIWPVNCNTRHPFVCSKPTGSSNESPGKDDNYGAQILSIASDQSSAWPNSTHVDMRFDRNHPGADFKQISASNKSECEMFCLLHSKLCIAAEFSKQQECTHAQINLNFNVTGEVRIVYEEEYTVFVKGLKEGDKVIFKTEMNLTVKTTFEESDFSCKFRRQNTTMAPNSEITTKYETVTTEQQTLTTTGVRTASEEQSTFTHARNTVTKIILPEDRLNEKSENASVSCNLICYKKPTQKDTEEKIIEIKETLTLDKTKLSSAIRSKQSAKDPRLSSHAIGSIGTVVLCAVIGSIMLQDIPLVLRHLRYRFLTVMVL